MELTLDRTKLTDQYTLGILYETCNRKIFVLNTVEPPVRGLTTGTLATLNPGIYKIFLKPDRFNLDVLACLQKVGKNARMGFSTLRQPMELTDCTFDASNRMFSKSIWCGKFKDRYLLPDERNYNNFMIRLIIAKQHREPVTLNITNKRKKL